MFVRTVLCAALVVACGPKPDPDVARRLAAIEAQLAAQQKDLAEIKTAQGNSPELGAVLDNLENLTARIVKLESSGRIGAAPRPMRHEPDRAAV
jgi:hypothetical protein